MAYYFVSTVAAMKLGDKIAQLRADKGMTQKALASAAKCSQQAITKIENNRVGKSGYLPNIAKALDITVEEILKDLEPHNPKATTPLEKKPRAPDSKVVQFPRIWPFPSVDPRRITKLSKADRIRLDYGVAKELAGIEAAANAARKGSRG
jgi:transcriptional regulator with XRE-family HTH domain